MPWRVGARRALRALSGCLLATGAACHGAGLRHAPDTVVLPRIPRNAARFEIDRVSDSTATFRVFEASWVRVGMDAFVVDPMHRDALVARLTIISRDTASATALITSQVARVVVPHAVLVVAPPRVWWRTGTFWLGLAAGGATGAVAFGR